MVDDSVSRLYNCLQEVDSDKTESQQDLQTNVIFSLLKKLYINWFYGFIFILFKMYIPPLSTSVVAFRTPAETVYILLQKSVRKMPFLKLHQVRRYYTSETNKNLELK